MISERPEQEAVPAREHTYRPHEHGCRTQVYVRAFPGRGGWPRASWVYPESVARRVRYPRAPNNGTVWDRRLLEKRDE